MSYPHTNQKESQLAVRVRESDRNAYNTLFSLLWEPIYTYAGSILMNEALALDLVQEVFNTCIVGNTGIERLQTILKGYIL
ncbi:RNA polymerase sigma factor [Flagellimonas marinaquae]